MISHVQDGDLWTVTINRPEKAGALTRDMLTDLANIAAAAVNAKLFILTGTGRVFSAGADLGEVNTGLATDPVWERLSTAIAALDGLSIAALNGTTAGGALGMALACDLRICVPAAKFFYPVMKLGFLPQSSDPPRLYELVGPARAKNILLAGRKITADEALSWGLVDKVVPGSMLMQTAKALGEDVLGAKTDHIGAIKRMIGAHRD